PPTLFLITHAAHASLHPLSLHDALPILSATARHHLLEALDRRRDEHPRCRLARPPKPGRHRKRRVLGEGLHARDPEPGRVFTGPDRKSTRLNSSHVSSSYAVFCLKKKTE